jgi:hypothetical protein
MKHKHEWEWTPFWHRYTCKCGEAQEMSKEPQDSKSGVVIF